MGMSAVDLTGLPTAQQQREEQAAIDQMNMNATQYLGAGLGAGVSDPSPLLFAQAHQIGAVPTVSASFGQSTQMDRFMSAASVGGGIPQIQTGYNAPLTGQPFDYQSLHTQQQQDINNNTNGAGQWRSLGEIPIANVDYYRDLIQTTDQNRIMNWQNLLRSRGLDLDGKNQVLPSDGKWSPDWMNNLKEFFFSRFGMDAAYARDPATRATANQFLQMALGQDISSVGDLRSDATKATLINSWVHTAGDGSSPSQSLQDISDRYGPDVLDKAHNQMLHPGFFANLLGVTGQVGSLLGPFNPLRLALRIPGVENHVPQWLDTMMTGRQFVGDDTLKGFDNATRSEMQDMAGTVSQSTGLFGLLDWWNGKIGQSLVTAKYFFGDVASGKTTNVFDDWNRAQQYANNPWRGLWGDNWVGNNGVLDFIGNIGLTTAFDPTTYLMGIGAEFKLDTAAAKAEYDATEKLGLSAEERISRATDAGLKRSGTKLTAGARARQVTWGMVKRDVIARDPRAALGHTMDALLHPSRTAARETLGTFLDDNVQWDQLSRMLGEGRPEVNKALWEAKKSKDVSKILEFLDTHARGRVLDPSRYGIVSEAMKAYRPENVTRRSARQLAHLLDSHIGSQTFFDRDIPSSFGNFSAARDRIHLVSEAFGFTPEDSQKVMDMLVDGSSSADQQTMLNGLIGRAINERIKKDPEFAKRYSEVRGKTRITVPNRIGVGRVGVDVPQQVAGQQVAGREIPVLPSGMPGRIPTPVEGGRRFYLPIKDENGNVVEASTIATRYTFTDPADEARAQVMRDAITTAQNAVANFHDMYVADLVQRLGMTKDAAEQHVLGKGNSDYEMAMGKVQEQAADIVRALHDFADEKKASGIEGDTPAAAFSGQFEDDILLDHSPFDYIIAGHPRLAAWEGFQRSLGMDRFHALWKRLQTASLKTGFRSAFAEESGRMYLRALGLGPRAFATMINHSVRLAARRGSPIPKMPAHLEINSKRFAMLDNQDFTYFDPQRTAGYGQAMWDVMHNPLAHSSEGSAWIKGMKGRGRLTAKQIAKGAKLKRGASGGRAALFDWVRSNDPAAVEFRRRENIDPNNLRAVGRWADATHTKWMAITKYKPTDKEGTRIFDHMDSLFHEGEGTRMTRKEFDSFVQRNGGRPDLLPVAFGRTPYSVTNGTLGAAFNGITDIGHKLNSAVVSHHRERQFAIAYETAAERYEKLYPEWLNQGAEGEEKIRSAAFNEAEQTISRNTYQFQRSMVGQAVRSVFPFWGATASLSKFLGRESVANPFFGKTLADVTDQVDQARQQGHPGILPRMDLPMTGWLMQHLMGMGNGTDYSFDPNQYAYLSMDGSSMYTASFGPLILSPLRVLEQHNPKLQDELGQVPLFGLDYAQSQAAAFPWLADAAQGASMLNLPILGQVGGVVAGALGEGSRAASLEASQTQQDLAAALKAGRAPSTVTEGQVKDEVAKQLLAGAVGRYSFPGLSVSDQPKRQLTDVRGQMDKATTDAERQKILQANPDWAPLLVYENTDLAKLMTGTNIAQAAQTMSGNELRDLIIGQNPWVAAYKGVLSPDEPGVQSYFEPSLQRTMQDVAQGNLLYLKPDQIVANAQKQINISNGYLEYTPYEQAYQQMLAQMGIASTSTRAAQLKRQYLQPVLDDLAQNNPDWQAHYDQHTSGVTQIQAGERPINTLGIWEMLPWNDSLESQSSQSWRQLFVWRDDMASQLQQMILQNQSTSQQQRVVDQFNQLVAGLTQQDPVFASQISKFTYSKLDDVLQAAAHGY